MSEGCRSAVRRWGGGATLVLLVALSACRAASPAGGEAPLHQARVYSGSPLPRSSATFTSSAADLAPIAESIRATIRFNADLTGAGLAWDFQGRTEDYDPRVAGPVAHTLFDHGPAGPVVIADYGTLQAELAALTADPGLAMLLGAATLPPLPTSNLTDGIQLGLRFDLTDVRWLPPALGGGPGATLAVSVPVDVRIALDELLSPLFDVPVLRTSATTPIDVMPCGACTNPSASCADPPSVLAAGYRVPAISTALGYAPTDVDATYPAMGLNVIARPPAADDDGLAAVSGRASFNAVCPFVFAGTWIAREA